MDDAAMAYRRDMAKRWVDAVFEVVAGPYRPGDPHRTPKLRRWLYIGLKDRFGRPLWYRPPRFTRWKLAGMLCAGVVLYVAVILTLAVLLQHH